MLTCKNLIDGKCKIVRDLVDQDYEPTKQNCGVCSLLPNRPQDVNCFTLQVAFSSDMNNESVYFKYLTECEDQKEIDKAHLEVYGKSNEDGEDIAGLLPSQIFAPSHMPPGGPGTELKKLLSWFAAEKKSCSCKDHQVIMDRWGSDKCEKNADKIIGWLLEEAKKRHLPSGKFGEMVARKMLKRAINNSRFHSSTPLLIPDPLYDIAITTAPRQNPTIEQCITSFRLAGWEPTVYAEPDSLVTNARTVKNAKKRGIWHNFLWSAKQGLKSGKEYIITAQDDITIHPDSKKLVDNLIVTRPECFQGFLSLYTPKHFSIIQGKLAKVGVRQVYTRSLWGACFLVWHRDVLERVVSHPLTDRWLGAPVRTKSAQREIYARRRADSSLIANSDTAIGRIMNDLNLPMHFVDPSPAQHIARFSTIGHGGNGGRRNCWRCADHDESLAKQVFGAE